ncbi:hypothetical protein JXO52_14050 [bacterium]|nr:hypothetical protein [bacterium]
MMIGIVITAFLLGGIVGMLGMAVLSYGPRTILERERHTLMKRLQFLEQENTSKRFTPVRDPRPHVHKLVN